MYNQQRYQNDRHFVWYFYTRAGESRIPYDLSGLDLSLEVQAGLSKTQITDFSVTGNAVDFVFRGRDQKRPGPIFAKLCINKGQPGMVTIDAPAGLMSPHSTPWALASGAETASEGIISFLGEWVDDRLIPATIARKSDLENYYTKDEMDERVGGTAVLEVKSIPANGHYTASEFESAVCSRDDWDKLLKGQYAFVRIPGQSSGTVDDEYLLVLKTPDTGYDASNVSFVGATGVYGIVYKERFTQSLRITVTTTYTAWPSVQEMTGWSAQYTKPASGIPATDLAEAVRTSLGKADTALQEHQSLAPITEKIPAQASAQNQLADKGFVNSSIATATATYRGSHNLVTDLGLATAATQVQIAAALATAVATADNNDYAFVQVPTADATPTEIARVDRYKYNGSAWAYEYTLNSSGFTAAQWAALNSAITSGLVAKLSDLPTYAELQQLLAGKQPLIDAQHKLDYDLLYNTPAPPSVPDISTDIEADKTSDTKTASPKAVHAVTGSLPSLNTTNKSSLVAAINEVASRGGEVEEAPNDGHMYARQSGSWARAEHLSERIVCLDFGVNEDTIGWLNAFGSAINIRRIGASNCATILISYGSVTQQAVTAGTVNLNVPVDSPVVIEITRTMASARAIVGIEFVITSNNS